MAIPESGLPSVIDPIADQWDKFRREIEECDGKSSRHPSHQSPAEGVNLGMLGLCPVDVACSSVGSPRVGNETQHLAAVSNCQRWKQKSKPVIRQQAASLKSGFRAHDGALIRYSDAPKNQFLASLFLQFSCASHPLADGEYAATERVSLAEFYQRTSVYYLPYLIFSSKTMLASFSDTSKVLTDLVRQQQQLDSVYLHRLSEKVGWGVFAAQLLEPGWTLGEYAGVVIPRLHGSRYLMQYFASENGQFDIDASHMGNIIRFINHSAQPNVAVVERRSPDGILHLEFEVVKPVLRGQQLFIDYGPGYWLHDKPLVL